MFFRTFHPPTTATSLLLFTTTVLLFSAPSLAQKQIADGLSLLETDYVSSLNTIRESDAVSEKYTLIEFLSSVVAKSGLRVSEASEDDQKLKGFKSGFTWDPEDEATFESWEPIGVATWQDSILGSLTDAKIKGVDKDVKGTLIASWKDKTTDKTKNGGVRVTFVVNGTESEGRYVHVLLVGEVEETKDGKLSFDKINVTDGGGIVWHGGWLYLGNAVKGLRAFDLNNIWKVDSESAFGMEYILPQARNYNATKFPTTYRTFTFDFLSLDRSEPSAPALLVGEYEDSLTGYTYMAKWPLNTTTGRLEINSKTKISSAIWAYKISVLRVRGIIWAHGKYFIARLIVVSETNTGDLNEQGELYIWAPGSNVDPILRVLPRGVGGLAYSPKEDRMWAVGVTEGNRGVVGIRAGVHLGIDPGDEEDDEQDDEQNSPSPSDSGSNTTGTSTNTPPNSTSNPPTDDDETPPTKSKIPTILGGVLGSLAAIAIVLWLILVLLRRRYPRDQKFPHDGRYLPSQDTNPGYPPPGFVYGTEDGYYHKGEIPMLKSELDASSTQLQPINSFNSQNYDQQGQVGQQQQYPLHPHYHPHGGAAMQPGYVSGTQSRERVDEAWEAKKAASAALARGIPQRKPVPGSRGKTADGKKEGPWVELPAVERQVEVA